MSIRLAILFVPLALCASAAPLAAQPSSALEVALSEFRCHVSDSVSATDAQRECLDTQIAALRADFGRDLSKLSAANRKGMDEACSRFTGPGQRTAYLLCVSDQLTALRSRQAGASATAPGAAPPTIPEAAVPAVPPPAPAPSRVLMIGAAVGLGVLAAIAFFFVAKKRPVRQKCRVCGIDVHDTDLCTKCRHEAAAAARHVPAASPAAHVPERPPVHAPAMEFAPVIEYTMRHEDVPPVPAPPPVAPVIIAPAIPVEPPRVEPVAEAKSEDAVFDPYSVLGVSFEAGKEKIRSAYEESKAKYDPAQVSYLGDEAQAHYRMKAEQVERAYQILTGAPVS